MILSPTDAELTWSDVEASLDEDARMAENIWFEAGIIMPDGAADDMKLDAMEGLLTDTANALGIPLMEVFPARNRIHWMIWTNVAGVWPIFASLDGGAPVKIIAEKSIQ